MKNKKYWLYSLLVLLTASIPFFSLSAQQKKPNIIIILADDLGWGDVGFNGSEIKTPNIDQLAKDGVILTRFYTAPVCSPTRAGLMTGRYPNRFGLRETVVPPWSTFGVDTSEKFLPELLKNVGYTNRAVLGKWHLGHAKKSYLPLSKGFTHFYGHYNGAIDYFTHKREGELDWHNDWETSFDKGYSTDLISDEAVKCISNYAKSSNPFLLYVAYNAPHGPLQAKEDDLLAYGYNKSKPVFGKKNTEEHGNEGTQGRGNTPRQTYSAMVTCMDKGIGKILAQLKASNIADNTLVLFFSDNGAAPGEGGSSGVLRGTKFQEWDGGVRAPAVIKWPKMFKAGTQNNQLMGYIDIVPTLLNISGATEAIQKPLDGLNMFAVLTGKQKEINRDLYLGYGSLVSNQWKLAKADAGNPRMKQKEDQLFDILNDPSEKVNLKLKHPDVYQQLLKKVASYDAIVSEFTVPPYGEGRKEFKAPKNWTINGKE
ncbi:MAG TPA: arylsulfatase [Pelobium sp.]|nr:arylsulfatase [Pelobium sp.]